MLHHVNGYKQSFQQQINSVVFLFIGVTTEKITTTVVTSTPTPPAEGIEITQILWKNLKIILVTARITQHVWEQWLFSVSQRRPLPQTHLPHPQLTELKLTQPVQHQLCHLHYEVQKNVSKLRRSACNYTVNLLRTALGSMNGLCARCMCFVFFSEEWILSFTSYFYPA